MTPIINEIEVLEDYKILLIYESGERKIYDMKPNLQYEMYKKLKDYELFKKVYSIGETIEWETGEDISPETLYLDSKSLN